MARFSNSNKSVFGTRKPYILLICTGNTCRSPMAYGILKKLFAEHEVHNITIRTAGVMTIPGLLPTPECRQLLFKEGMDISNHRSSQLTPEMIRRAHLILGMTPYHVQMALRMSESARDKTFLLKEYVGADSRNSQIQDPMGCTLEVYTRVFREIRAACKKLVKMDLTTPSPAPKRTKRRGANRAARSTVEPEQRPTRAAKSAAGPPETPLPPQQQAIPIPESTLQPDKAAAFTKRKASKGDTRKKKKKTTKRASSAAGKATSKKKTTARKKKSTAGKSTSKKKTTSGKKKSTSKKSTGKKTTRKKTAGSASRKKTTKQESTAKRSTRKNKKTTKKSASTGGSKKKKKTSSRKTRKSTSRKA